jgi:alpha-L-arabinofuranosidase
MDMVSLFPKETFKGRENGIRKDLGQMIADMKPAFVRFPGGCYVEGNLMANAFRWKKSIGDIAERSGHMGIWGYYSTGGLGYHEYLQFCEDLGAEPLFVINCGMAHGDSIPMDQLQEYVQDALDAIEYANGPVDSKWGSLRAKAGHPKPFHLKMIEVGNENGGKLYDERYAVFYDALKARYPEVKIVANERGGIPTSRPREIVDEHYYSSPEFFMRQARRYDSYDRSNYKVYVGEYATTQSAGLGNVIAALGEAAFMTGLERNGDVVTMASYAPLLVNPNWRGWNPNAIVFDSSRAYGIPSYHVQTMFAKNRADVVVPVAVESPVAPPPTKARMIGVGTLQVILWVCPFFKAVNLPSLAFRRSPGALGAGSWCSEI